MVIVPIANIYAQVLTISLGGQRCRIKVYQKSTGVYCDLLVNDALVIGGVFCTNLTRIVRDDYLGFIGDLIFNDTQGTDDPLYPGLGTRFLLFYLEPGDLNPVESA